MKLKAQTVSLLFLFLGIMTTIFGAFFSYVAYTRKNELYSELVNLEKDIEDATTKNVAVETFFRQFYELISPSYRKYSGNIKYLQSLVNCLATKANFSLEDKEVYEKIKKEIKRYVRLAKNFRVVSSCYFSYKGVLPNFFLKIMNKLKFDITGEESARRPTIVKLVSAYLERINKLEKEIDDLRAKVETTIQLLRKYIFISDEESFGDIKESLDAKIKELASKKLEDFARERGLPDAKLRKIPELEESLEKQNVENRLLIYTYFLRRKMESFTNAVNEGITNKLSYITGLVGDKETKEFALRGEIFTSEDYEILCGENKAKVELPPSCIDIKDAICEGPKRGQNTLKSFAARITEFVSQQLAKRNELVEVQGIKFRLDRNDVTLLVDYKNSDEKLPTTARNIITLRQTKKTLEDQIEKIRSRIAKRKLEKKPVGKLLGLDYKYNRGIINLGRRHGLFNNTIFEVYGMIKGREFVFKGLVKILKLGEDNSKVMILPVVIVEDKNFIVSQGAGVAFPQYFSIITKEFSKKLPYTDIIKIAQIKGLKAEVNDALFSEVFDPQHKKVISFAGNLHLIYTNAEAAKKFTLWNFKYQEKADTNNDYVILGKDYQDSENYRIAKDLNIKLLREKDFYDFLELEYRD